MLSSCPLAVTQPAKAAAYKDHEHCSITVENQQSRLLSILELIQPSLQIILPFLPSHVLLKLVDQFPQQRITYNDVEEDEEPRNLYNITIGAEFYILGGLNNNITLGEDLLASVNAFVCPSGNFKAVISPKASTQR
jgi:hypothetical protein